MSRGGDIRLRYTEEPPPLPGRAEMLFDSGGVWRVERAKGGLLYSFRIRGRRPPLYKVVSIDEGLREGWLHFDPSPRGPHFALDYPLDELLFQHRLAREGAAEVHGCGVVWKGRTLLFCGRSGAGKSTTARLWKRHARGAQLLSDDRVVLRPVRGGVRASGTPWHGDGGFASPASARLGAVFFLRHGKTTRLTPLGTAEAAARLFARSFPPPGTPKGWKALSTPVPTPRRRCRPSTSRSGPIARWSRRCEPWPGGREASAGKEEGASSHDEAPASGCVSDSLRLLVQDVSSSCVSR